MRVAVTGANGHLGSTLCRHLLAKRIDVVACLRPPRNAARVPAGVIHVASCDLMNARELAQSFDGSEVVFHTAAPTQLWSKSHDDIEKPILEGTLNVIRACAQAGVRKIIYTSSCSAVGFRAELGAELNEENYNHDTKHPQFRAKLNSEREGEELALALGVQLIRVCVPSVVGPGFKSLTPSVEPYVQLVRGALRVVPDLCYSLLDVRDLADAQIGLAQGDPKERRYIVAGNFVTTASLLCAIREVDGGLKLPKVFSTRFLPWLAGLDAVLHYAALRLTRRRLTLDLARECVGANQRLSDRRFRSEFPQWQARPLNVTLQDTLSWIRSEYV